MIRGLWVRNFKSLKDLRLRCRRVNVFIGRPNTGKSNILEVVGLLGHLYYGDLDGFVRYVDLSNLFYDQDLSSDIIVNVELVDSKYTLRIKHRDGLVIGYLKRGDNTGSEQEVFKYDFIGRGARKVIAEFKVFKLYRFLVKDKFGSREAGSLLPPHGDNLLSVLMGNKEIRRLIRDILAEYGLKLVLKPVEHKIEFEKEIDDIAVSYPYSLLSDTLQRIIFHLVAIESNRDSIIAFEEPEAHAFPYYTKFLAERIALDKNNNQYFISTHNPYFLLSLIEKTRLDDLAVFITYYEDYQTKVKQLSREEIEKILDLGPDVFFNIESFIEGRK